MGALLQVGTGIPGRVYRWVVGAGWARRWVDLATRRYRTTPRRIRRGVGAGLWFNPHGGHLGYALGTSETDEQAALASLLHPGDVFFDVGANKGFFAVIGARLVGPEGAVHAFEPFAPSAEAVSENARLNGFDQIKVWTVAVSDHAGSERLITGGDDVGYRIATSLNSTSESDSSTADVEVIRLDDLVESGVVRPPNVVMIDVEGAEVAVLRGMAGTIARHRPTIMCEVHWIQSELDAFVDEVLDPLGYVVTQLDGSPRPAELTRYHLLMRPAPGIAAASV